MEPKIYDTVESLIAERRNALLALDFFRAREIEENLKRINVEITETPNGIKWVLN